METGGFPTDVLCSLHCSDAYAAVALTSCGHDELRFTDMVYLACELGQLPKAVDEDRYKGLVAELLENCWRCYRDSWCKHAEFNLSGVAQKTYI